MKICFVGCGNIAQAIIDGLLKSGIATSNIACVERNEKRAKLLRAQCLQIIELEKISLIDFNLIILAVKPKDALSAEKNIFKLAPNATILTVVAGISIKKYSQPDAIIRAMPNTACAFRKGITGIYAKDQNCTAFKNTVSLFRKVGHVLELKSENELHRFTSIIGSGQAFLYQVLNIYLQELEKISPNQETDIKLMFEDFVGSLGDAFSQEQNFESLINKIKSPGGTTQAGLESLEMNGLSKILLEAFEAAEDRSMKISNEQ